MLIFDIAMPVLAMALGPALLPALVVYVGRVTPGTRSLRAVSAILGAVAISVAVFVVAALELVMGTVEASAFDALFYYFGSVGLIFALVDPYAAPAGPAGVALAALGGVLTSMMPSILSVAYLVIRDTPLTSAGSIGLLTVSTALSASLGTVMAIDLLPYQIWM